LLPLSINCGLRINNPHLVTQECVKIGFLCVRTSVIIQNLFLKPQCVGQMGCIRGSSINNVGNWEGEEGSKIGQNCQQIVLENG
jgi:hypothetical protein